MSLIEEALRRVKDPLVPPASSAPEKPAKKPRQAQVSQATPAAHSWSPSPAASASRTPSSSLAPLTMVTLAILALTAALIFGGAVWMWQALNGHLRATPESANPVSTEEMAADPSSSISSTADSEAQSAHSTSKELVPEFNVTGIVEGLGDPYAMINGSIVAVGGTIGRATLTGISEGTVTLQLADGKETVVRVQR